MSEQNRSLRDQFEEMLVEFLFGELTPEREARFQELLRSNPSWRTEVDEHARLLASIPKQPEMDPPQAVVDEVLRESRRHLETLGARGQHSFWKGLWSGFRPLIAVSAAAALTVVVGYYAVEHAVEPDAPGSRARMEQELRPSPKTGDAPAGKHAPMTDRGADNLAAAEKADTGAVETAAVPGAAPQDARRTAASPAAEPPQKAEPLAGGVLREGPGAATAATAADNRPAAAPVPDPQRLLSEQEPNPAPSAGKAEESWSRQVKATSYKGVDESLQANQEARANRSAGDGAAASEAGMLADLLKSDKRQDSGGSVVGTRDAEQQGRTGAGGAGYGGAPAGVSVKGDSNSEDDVDERNNTNVMLGSSSGLPASNEAPVVDSTANAPSQVAYGPATPQEAVGEKVTMEQKAQEEYQVRRRETAEGTVQQAFVGPADGEAEKNAPDNPAKPAAPVATGVAPATEQAKEAPKEADKKKADKAQTTVTLAPASTDATKNDQVDCNKALSSVSTLVIQGRFSEAESALKALEAGPCEDKVSDGKRELMRARIELGRGQREKAKARLKTLTDDPDAAKDAEILLESVEP